MLTGSASAAPLLQRNQNPLLAGIIPLLPPAKLLPLNHSRFDIRFNLTNSLNLQGAAEQKDYLIYDAETAVIELQWLKRINRNWLAGVQLPFLHHGSGELDNFIENYHDVLQLPQGDRPLRLQDQFRIFYQNNGETRLDLRDSISGSGDLSLLLAHPFVENAERLVTVYSRLQLPTGKPSELTGVGVANVAGWIASEWQPQALLALSADFGLIVAPNSDRSKIASRENVIWFGAAAAQWNASSKLKLITQFSANSRVFEQTDVDLLGHAVLLLMGGTLELKPGLKLEVTVSEDIQVNASPDVTLQIGFTVNLGKYSPNHSEL